MLSTNHSRALALEAATQGIVLLKNDPVNSSASVVHTSGANTSGANANANANTAVPRRAARPLLPLARGARVALVGPHFNASDDMLSNYKGANNIVYSHTPLAAMTAAGTVVASARGCGLFGSDETGFPAAVAAARTADVAVVFLGLHPQWFDPAPVNDASEGEDRDRLNITLPDVQNALLRAVQVLSSSWLAAQPPAPPTFPRAHARPCATMQRPVAPWRPPSATHRQEETLKNRRAQLHSPLALVQATGTPTVLVLINGGQASGRGVCSCCSCRCSVSSAGLGMRVSAPTPHETFACGQLQLARARRRWGRSPGAAGAMPACTTC